MISAPDRRQMIELIQEAVDAGARIAKACEIATIDVRTYQRWMTQADATRDGRCQAKRQAPANQLYAAEREMIIEVCNQDRFARLPPTQIVPTLADEGVYIASESTFYRVLRAVDQVKHRGRSRSPNPVSKPDEHRAA